MEVHQLYLIGPMIFLVALLYSSVGHGGATGYIAVLTLFSIPDVVIASTSLVLNILVSGISLLHFRKAGYFKGRLLWPFLFGSMPMAFLGGYIKLSSHDYELLFGLLILFAAYRLFFGKTVEKPVNFLPESFWIKCSIGAILGFVSGLIGVGGGIFLSPLILLLGWADAKTTASVSAVFIFFNSLTGILGRFTNNNFSFHSLGILWIILAAFLGSLLGARLGAYKFNNLALRRILGVVLFFAGARLFFTLFN